MPVIIATDQMKLVFSLKLFKIGPLDKEYRF